MSFTVALYSKVKSLWRAGSLAIRRPSRKQKQKQGNTHKLILTWPLKEPRYCNQPVGRPAILQDHIRNDVAVKSMAGSVVVKDWTLSL